ncbi:ATP synthase peripheral stalk subunit F6, mitochondrial-like [Tubulanus polymorphus]|uniref:ATP synthase peripheral stalk subunit F6, mitochondrial-like n=1 Tax=Tubulanus polymorphus TaxID=672921 RepID=UPI003DA416BC
MLGKVVINNLRQVHRVVTVTMKRNIGVTAATYQKTDMDPIQKLFVDKIREYGKASKSAGGAMVDVTPDVEKNLNAELSKIEKAYQATGQDMTKFPVFNFTDPDLQKVDIGVDQQEAQAKHEKLLAAEREQHAAANQQQEAIDPDTPYYSY